MKNINFKIFAASLFLALGFQACSDDDKLPIDFDELNTMGGAFATELSSEGSTDINAFDPTTTMFTKSYELNSRNNGEDISKLEIFVSYDGATSTVAETLYKDIPASEFSSGPGARPKITVDYDSGELMTLLGLTMDDLEGGDILTYRLALTTPDGTFSDVSPNFDNQSADHNFASTVICIPTSPITGDWELDMQDSYGDGWNGANIAVVIDGVSTSYEPEGAGSVIIVNVPDGTETLEFIYSPGDWEEEVTFTITSPTGNTTYSDGPNPATGTLPLSYCNE